MIDVEESERKLREIFIIYRTEHFVRFSKLVLRFLIFYRIHKSVKIFRPLFHSKVLIIKDRSAASYDVLIFHTRDDKSRFLKKFERSEI